MAKIQDSCISLTLEIGSLYKFIYQLGKNIPKKDRFGIFSRLENSCIDCLKKSIQAALTKRTDKYKLVGELRIEIGIMKQFVRLVYEINIIEFKHYREIQEKLQEISKMATGWWRYLQN